MKLLCAQNEIQLTFQLVKSYHNLVYKMHTSFKPITPVMQSLV